MLKRLPDFVEPMKLADEQTGLLGSIPLSDMPRLLEASTSDGDVRVEVELHFGRDEFNIRNLQGHGKCHLQMVCQRCMGTLEMDLEVDLALALVSTEEEAEEARFPEKYEALVVDNKTMKLAPIIEDELLLALPVVAVHEDEHCNQVLDDLKQEGVVEEAGDKPNPFSILKGLKTDKP